MVTVLWELTVEWGCGRETWQEVLGPLVRVCVEHHSSGGIRRG